MDVIHIQGPCFYSYINVLNEDYKQYIHNFGDIHARYDTCKKEELSFSDLIKNTILQKQSSLKIDIFLELFPSKFFLRKDNYMGDFFNIFKNCIILDIDGDVIHRPESCEYPNAQFHLCDIRWLFGELDDKDCLLTYKNDANMKNTINRLLEKQRRYMFPHVQSKWDEMYLEFRNQVEAYNKPSVEIMSLLLDLYTISRMCRVYKNSYPKNCIIYTGVNHSENIMKFFSELSNTYVSEPYFLPVENYNPFSINRYKQCILVPVNNKKLLFKMNLDFFQKWDILTSVFIRNYINFLELSIPEYDQIDIIDENNNLIDIYDFIYIKEDELLEWIKIHDIEKVDMIQNKRVLSFQLRDTYDRCKSQWEFLKIKIEERLLFINKKISAFVHLSEQYPVFKTVLYTKIKRSYFQITKLKRDKQSFSLISLNDYKKRLLEKYKKNYEESFSYIQSFPSNPNCSIEPISIKLNLRVLSDIYLKKIESNLIYYDIYLLYEDCTVLREEGRSEDEIREFLYSKNYPYIEYLFEDIDVDYDTHSEDFFKIFNFLPTRTGKYFSFNSLMFNLFTNSNILPYLFEKIKLASFMDKELRCKVYEVYVSMINDLIDLFTDGKIIEQSKLEGLDDESPKITKTLLELRRYRVDIKEQICHKIISIHNILQYEIETLKFKTRSKKSKKTSPKKTKKTSPKKTSPKKTSPKKTSPKKTKKTSPKKTKKTILK